LPTKRKGLLHNFNFSRSFKSIANKEKQSKA